MCDFVITKPGGAQTTESLYFKKPVIMINCSGGQEIANYKYFVKNGYGRRFRTSYMFAKCLKEIADHPEIISKMQKNMAQNNNDQAMAKLYKIAMEHLES